MHWNKVIVVVFGLSAMAACGGRPGMDDRARTVIASELTSPAVVGTHLDAARIGAQNADASVVLHQLRSVDTLLARALPSVGWREKRAFAETLHAVTNQIVALESGRASSLWQLDALSARVDAVLAPLHLRASLVFGWSGSEARMWRELIAAHEFERESAGWNGRVVDDLLHH